MYKATRRGEVLELLFYDDIGEGWFGGISSGQVASDIGDNDDAKEINVRINSPGGDVFEGLAIYNSLIRSDAKVAVDIEALAASSASLVAMAGDEIRMERNSMLMIHNPWTIAAGDEHELTRVSALLSQVKNNFLPAYESVSGIDREKLIGLLDAETWYTAEEAVAEGFAHSVVDSQQAIAAAAFDPRRFRRTPERFQAHHVAPQGSPLWKRERDARERRMRLRNG